jgi:hypothetical protein
MHPMICWRTASLRFADTSSALTVTCGQSSRFSLVSRRKPNPALPPPEQPSTDIIGGQISAARASYCLASSWKSLRD